MSIKLVPAKSKTPSVVPQLVPFHIDHTGPAPISTYFRPKPSPAAAGATTPQADAATSTNANDPQDASLAGAHESAGSQIDDEASQSTVDASQIITDASNASLSTASLAPSPSPAPGAQSDYVAAFRGRAMHGSTITLPDGYAGVVLREAPPVNRAPLAQRRPSEVDAMDVDEGEGEEEGARSFTASATFSSFTLWNPDIPVDRGRDEYLRGLTEWVALAQEIHRTETIPATGAP